MTATYNGETTDQFTQGKDYIVSGFGDSIVIILDDKNLLASLAYATLNNPKVWSLKQ